MEAICPLNGACVEKTRKEKLGLAYRTGEDFVCDGRKN